MSNVPPRLNLSAPQWEAAAYDLSRHEGQWGPGGYVVTGGQVMADPMRSGYSEPTPKKAGYRLNTIRKLSLMPNSAREKW